jgi:hypothetical protein
VPHGGRQEGDQHHRPEGAPTVAKKSTEEQLKDIVATADQREAAVAAQMLANMKADQAAAKKK